MLVQLPGCEKWHFELLISSFIIAYFFIHPLKFIFHKPVPLINFYDETN